MIVYIHYGVYGAVENVHQEADVAAIDGHEIPARERQPAIALSPIKHIGGGSSRESLDRVLKSGQPPPRFGECSGGPLARDSRCKALRYAVCPLMGIEWADWRQFFSHLAPADIRYRFGRLVSVDAALRLLTLPNRYGSVIFGAFCSEGLVGLANLAKDDAGQAEIAILVRSDWKRQGIGEALMWALLCQATREHLQIYGIIQPSNSAIVGLMRRFGFVSGPRQIDYTIMHWHPADTEGRTGHLAEQEAGIVH
jgi:GNAT superfamily N-acetyltransferase